MPKPINTGPQWVGPDLAIRPGMHPLVAKAILSRTGFEILGKGAVCAAFRLGQSNRVLKLVCDRAGHRAAVKLFRERPDVEAFPTIFGVVELSHDCFIYETEFLTWGPACDNYCGYRPEVWWGGLAEDFGDDVAEALQELTAEADAMVDTDFAFYLDLHDQNYMAREDGTRVITDPFHLHAPKCNEGLRCVRSGSRVGEWVDLGDFGWDEDKAYWSNVASTVPYRGATTTALVPLALV